MEHYLCKYRYLDHIEDKGVESIKKYIKTCGIGTIIALILLLTIGCSVTHAVKTSSTRSLTTELKEEVPAIKQVAYTFTRPNLTITINLKDNLSEEAEASVVDKVKQFSTDETNISEIAESVNWNSEISNIYLIIEHASEASSLRYSARYFKTYDASNTSEENIDGYQTWSKFE